ncbi:MAG: hypothetical protein CVT81_01410 [Alphaproteobacteria bacterium HGW-Alphaproteobacteria-3]|nr:MAG: hypothetical protein CVT81_01410 [Alphaproteobacteria bacterium HGW-Alphaproteobacteria-3]
MSKRLRGAPGVQMVEFGVIILAGGDGARIGGRKAERFLAGKRLIDHVSALVNGLQVPAVVNVRQRGQVGKTCLPEITDHPAAEGPLAGLLAGMDWALANNLAGFVTYPCDSPFLPCDLFLRLVAAVRETGCPAVAAQQGASYPTSAAWPFTCQGTLRKYALEGRRSLHGALERCRAVQVEWSPERSAEFMNINTMEDLLTAEHVVQSGTRRT